MESRIWCADLVQTKSLGTALCGWRPSRMAVSVPGGVKLFRRSCLFGDGCKPRFDQVEPSGRDGREVDAPTVSTEPTPLCNPAKTSRRVCTAYLTSERGAGSDHVGARRGGKFSTWSRKPAPSACLHKRLDVTLAWLSIDGLNIVIYHLFAKV